MPIDKSWMNGKNRLSREYRTGVKEFVEHAKPHVNHEGQMRCPCMKCLNQKFQIPRAVEMHLFQNGIQSSYRVWSFHGESFHNPLVDYSGDEDDNNEDDEMAGMLIDLARHGGHNQGSCGDNRGSGGDNCGSGGDQSTTRKRKTRAESRSVVVEKMLRKQKTDKLIVKFDPHTGKSLEKSGKTFNNMIAQLVRSTFSPRFTRWEDVPKTDIETVYSRLDLKFVYPHDDKIVMDEIERLQMKAFREWRYEMKCFWKKLGGEENAEAPKSTPYKRIAPEDWNILCDFFSSEDQKKISSQNSQNRKRRPFEGGHGSKTIVSHMYDGADPLTGKLPSVIDTFQQLHCKPKKGWRNEYAAEKFDAMTQIRDSQPPTAAATGESAGSTEYGEEVAQPKDLEIMTEVLGPRSRYHKGYGSMPRLKAIGGNRAVNVRSIIQEREKDTAITVLKEQVAIQGEQLASQQAMLASQQAMFAQLASQMQQLVPGFQFQPPTLPTSANSGQSPSRTHTQSSRQDPSSTI
ncbi:uncharacterized protein LOC115709754 isoform X1 [Cannabis sativa]|uniref:uncharacterized protein LOC115709754 isoform X1 n=2 Tax=Cannabis sativa TaxID=3483 RepID=UPI0029C9BA2A|nr:uncharacterized protein LOC115709754 isoform X1 [Cannabis sativa]XP_030493810.2 uncharacterized protein LOC115709754 isoform X1 [Cannabis sativa]XP_030493811.2 uncharacterized protein LOC115709754 isoform X1 [Cannabis sativa]XP_060968257.1 uncharacterized protein LOC115709754 isoform X1 [Cannabis sativa]XP_060968258.1 uncharacterized protein LOC115709754 isoform X1 [Cannabis sativa]